jgi:hypothetical protein
VNGLDPSAPSGDSVVAEHEAGSTKAAQSALEFLNLLRPVGPWQLSPINPNINNDIKTVTATTTDQARGFTNHYNGNRNLCYAPNPVRVKDKKASKAEVLR